MLREPRATSGTPVGPTGKSPRLWALLAAASPTGWFLYDIAVFARCGEPFLIVDLLPVSLAIIAIAGASGAMLGAVERRLALFILALGILAGLLAPGLYQSSVSPAADALPRVVASLVLAACAAGITNTRTRLGPVRSGLAFGALAGVGVGFYRGTAPDGSTLLAVAAVALLACGFLRRPIVARLATVAIVIASAWTPLSEAIDDTRLGRPDDSAIEHRAELLEAPNLILIVLDTVRADHLSTYGYERETMPGLDRLAQERCVVFENARSTSSWTLPSHASLLTGLQPSQHGASHPRSSAGDSVGLGAWPALPLSDDVPTVTELLRDAGYRTGAIVANDVYLNHRYGLDRGFEHYDDRRGGWVKNHFALAQFTGRAMRAGHLLYRDAERITDLALAWLANEAPVNDAKRPFFLMLNYMDAHGPYLPPPPFDGAFSSDRPLDPLRPSKEWNALLYDRELLYLDSQLTRLLNELEARGLLENTAVVITSDHGEALGQHGFWLHGWTLYDSVVRVPLILKLPGSNPPRREPRPIGGDEVHDLMLEALGLEHLRHGREREDQDVDGEWFQLAHIPDSSILGNEDLARDLVFWIEDGIKTIVTSTGIVRTFDVARDPGEVAPLPLTDEEIEVARRRAEVWWRTHPPHQNAQDELDAEWFERASGLGYTTGSPSE